MQPAIPPQMSPPNPPTVLIIGGTGAQGIPVVKALVHDGAYKVRLLTRDPSSPRARQLQALRPDLVDLVEGTFASEDDLRRGFRGAEAAFVNIDGFNAGEKTEMFWAVRAYELAIEEGVQFFVYANLDFVYKKSGYDARFRTGHYDGKGRVGEWILQQNKDNATRMQAALFTTGPYIQMAIAKTTPMSPTVEDGIVTWRAPLGDGAVAHVDLDDCGYYVRWLLEHRERANGMDLAVAVDMVGYRDLAAAFTKVTGRPARYESVGDETYWTTGPMAAVAGRASGYNAAVGDAATVTVRENFTGFWKVWEHSGGNRGLVRRDFGLLDDIFPGRTRSVEEWFRKEEKRGVEAGLGGLWERVNALKPILKNHEDGRKGRI